MKRKILLTFLFVIIVSCIFAISAFAEILTDFINVDLTLADGSQTTGYLVMESGSSGWNGYTGYSRKVIYADYTDNSQTISWADVRVFDGRNSEICTYDGETVTKTGTYPQTLLGHPNEAGQDVSKVTHVYYPQGSLIIADTSFATSRSWSAIEYLWVPSSVEIIGENACNGLTNLKTVEFEENSSLTAIGGGAFQKTGLTSLDLSALPLETIGMNAIRECESLTSIKFPETLTTIGYCAFYKSAISGKVVIPNSVTSISDGAFRETYVETLVLGDGSIELGYNLVGNDNSKNTYLKEVYIPIEATFVNQPNNAWFVTKDTIINFYVIAKEGEDVSDFISTLKSTGRVEFATQDEVDAGTASSGYNALIITGYNKCDAFYEGQHEEVDDFICVTNNLCQACNKIMTEGLENHELLSTVKYPNGFGEEGVCGRLCTNASCAYVDGEETVADAIFGASGYSTNSDRNALDGGFTFDSEAYSDYLDATSDALRFGIIIVNAESFAQGASMLDEQGKLNSTFGMQVEMTTTQYSKFSYQINNFDANSSVNLELIFVLYVIDSNGNVSYIQSDSDYANNTTIGTTSFDSVNLNLVVAQEAKATAFGDTTEQKENN